jgi:hypothetical protein
MYRYEIVTPAVPNVGHSLTVVARGHSLMVVVWFSVRGALFTPSGDVRLTVKGHVDMYIADKPGE